jgi:hypothetical protein
MTVIYNMSIDRADKPWIGDRRLTEQASAEDSPSRDSTRPTRISGQRSGEEAAEF